ncbi:hypothetical protein bthur0013_8030 [Bacillus thuringiensis IBL 200]|nr:hypothetical protein bthur0013_8030 [Bacillus thuringiensis IBL 200]
MKWCILKFDKKTNIEIHSPYYVKKALYPSFGCCNKGMKNWRNIWLLS